MFYIGRYLIVLFGNPAADNPEGSNNRRLRVFKGYDDSSNIEIEGQTDIFGVWV